MSIVRNITINTDASWDPKTKAAGYAFWIICDDFKYRVFGEFRDIVKSPTEAETKTIANALAYLLRKKYLPEVLGWIIINTDCKFAIRDIENHSTDAGKMANNYLNQLRKRTKCVKFEFRYVKAHSNVSDARSKVNEWCDEFAKKAMRVKRGNINRRNELHNKSAK